MAGKKIVLVGDLGTDHEGFPPTPVIAGSPNVFMDGKPVARVGDPLAIHSKPKHPPHPRAIASGEPAVLINSMPVAVTGGAITCGDVTIGSGSGEVGDGSPSASFGSSVGNASAAAAGAMGTITDQARRPSSAAPVLPNSNVPTRSEQETTSASDAQSNKRPEETSKDPAHQSPEPGCHVVREPMSKMALLENLYGDASAKPDHFDRLNPNIGDRVLPGEMIVLGDPEGVACTREEADLMQVASQVNQKVRALDEADAQFLADHYDLLEVITSNAATGMGAGAVMISKQIAGIEITLLAVLLVVRGVNNLARRYMR